MSLRIPSHNRRGATLVVGLIMLVVITLMVTTAYTLSTSNLKSVGNMQFRNEAIAAGNAAIEQVLNTSIFTNYPLVGDEIEVDINKDGTSDYIVTIAIPVCIRATVAGAAELSSVTLGASMSTSYTWNTVWDIDATVEPTSSNFAASGTSVHLHSGVRALLSQADKDRVCPGT